MAINREGYAFIAQCLYPSLPEQRDESPRRIIIMIAQARPLSVRSTDLGQCFIQRPIKVAHPMSQKIPSMEYDVGLGARVVETTEPRDHRTHNFSAGASYRGPILLANLEYGGSLFRNRNRTLTWENPFMLGSSKGAEFVTHGRFALAPDNDWHNVRGDVSVALPWNGRLTTTVSWSRMRQDDDLIPPTINSGIVGSPDENEVDLGEWNHSGALSRSTADARVDTLLVNGRLQLRPWKPLRVHAGIRYFDRQNDTRYTAFNPIAGEDGLYGYIAEDGAHNVLTQFSRVFDPEMAVLGTDDFRFRSTPYDYRKLEYEFGSDYRLPKRTTIRGRFRSWLIPAPK